MMTSLGRHGGHRPSGDPNSREASFSDLHLWAGARFTSCWIPRPQYWQVVVGTRKAPDGMSRSQRMATVREVGLMSVLVVFDIDGTLTDTNDVDDDCFRAQWPTSSHSLTPPLTGLTHTITDSALARWLCQTHCHRDASEANSLGLTAHFVGLLRLELARLPALLSQPGAQGLFAYLRAAGGGSHSRQVGGSFTQCSSSGAGLHDSEIVFGVASDAQSALRSSPWPSACR